MQKETLEEAISRFIEVVSKMDKPLVEKIELMINVKSFLDPKKYENNIKVLSKENKKHL